MKNKCDLMIELLFWEKYNDSKKLIPEKTDNFYFYTSRNNK